MIKHIIRSVCTAQFLVILCCACENRMWPIHDNAETIQNIDITQSMRTVKDTFPGQTEAECLEMIEIAFPSNTSGETFIKKCTLKKASAFETAP